MSKEKGHCLRLPNLRACLAFERLSSDWHEEGPPTIGGPTDLPLADYPDEIMTSS